jgi:hypothetical protein
LKSLKNFTEVIRRLDPYTSYRVADLRRHPEVSKSVTRTEQKEHNMAKVIAKPGKQQKHNFGIPVARMDPPPWQTTVGMFISGQAEVDELDLVAIEMERRWGAGRLRLLVDTVMREKFDRQRYLLNQALWHGELQDVITQARRMIAAWRALDRAAEAAGRQELDTEVWEVAMPSGAVAAIVRDPHQAGKVAAQDRAVRVYTLDEIGRLIEGFPEILAAKQVFPGATVERVRTRVGDPLDAVPDSKALIDDVMPF